MPSLWALLAGFWIDPINSQGLKHWPVMSRQAFVVAKEQS